MEICRFIFDQSNKKTLQINLLTIFFTKPFFSFPPTQIENLMRGQQLTYSTMVDAFTQFSTENSIDLLNSDRYESTIRQGMISLVNFGIRVTPAGKKKKKFVVNELVFN